MATEPIEDLVHEEIQTRLRAISGSTYHYIPDRVWRAPMSERNLSESKLAYYVYSGEGFFEEDTSCTYRSDVTAFVGAAFRYEASTTAPWELEAAGKDPPERIKLRLQHDIRRALGKKPLRTEIEQMWVADREFNVTSTKDESMLCAIFQVSVKFSEVLEP